MKEATGETSMTVITIVLIAAVLAIGTFVLGNNGIARKWIINVFNRQTQVNLN